MDGPCFFQHLTAWVVVVVLLNGTNCQSLLESVDKVTVFSNDLLPKFLGPMVSSSRNVVFGPFGVANSLMLLLEASNGDTRQELLTSLNITEAEVAMYRVGFKAYCQSFLEHSANTEAGGAFNSVSVSEGLQMLPSFSNTIAEYYCAADTIDSPPAVGPRPTITLESHSGVMAHWKDFEKLAVYTFLSHQDIRPFVRRDGISTPVPMIPQVGFLKTADWKNARVIQLPLQTKIVDLLIIMPERANKINAIAKAITSSTISQIMNELQEEELEVFIPQLTTVSKHADLTATIRAMGIQLAFDKEKGDLSRATEAAQPVSLGECTQDAYFSTSFTSLNAVAGAASRLEQNAKSRRKRDATKVYLTKPFLYLVVHKDTHLILLAGKIEDPVQVPNS